MAAAIIGAVVAAGATAYNAYNSGGGSGVPQSSTATQLNKEQAQLAQLEQQLAKANAAGNSTKVASLQSQIANLKLVIAAQTQTLQNQAGNLPGNTPTPVVNVNGVQNKTLYWFGGIILAIVGYFAFFRKGKK